MLRKSVTLWRRRSAVKGSAQGPSTEMVATQYEPPPFDFEAIDAMCKIRENEVTKNIKCRLNIDRSEKKYLYSLMRESNATVYAAKNLGVNNVVPLSGESSFQKTQQEWICERVADGLANYPLDTRIIVLQRALAAWHHAGQKHWNRLAKISLRSCLLYDEMLKPSQIVKIFASLSKWRFRGFAEIKHKLDLAILAEDSWDIESASQILWSLAHLKAFDMKAFDYMNNVLTGAIGAAGFDITTLPDETIHRVLNANLIRMSHTGKHHRILVDLLDAVESQPIMVSHLSPKTMLAVTAVLPLCPQSGIASSILERVSQGLHKFTHAQAAHMFYNFVLVSHRLPNDVFDKMVGTLFEFKEMLYNVDCGYVPSLIAKLLFTFRQFLGAFDHCFVSKCLADLNANLHLLGPFSLVGNLHCIDLYIDECYEQLTEQQKQSIDNTLVNLVQMDDGNNNFVKPRFGSEETEPMDNLKLWHYAAIYRLTGKGREGMVTMLNSFLNGVNEDNLLGALKDFLLLLVNMDTEISDDRRFLNAILVVATQLWQMSSGSTKEQEYWDAIKYNLSVMGILKIFERECMEKQEDIVTGHDIDSMLSILGQTFNLDRGGGNLITGSVDVDNMLQRIIYCKNNDSTAGTILCRYLMFIAMGSTIGDELAAVAKRPLRNLLTEAFYGTIPEPLFNTKQKSKIPSDVLDYLNKVMQAPTEPLSNKVAYTKLFFSQDTPQLMLSILPDVALSQMFPQKCSDVNIRDVAAWLSEVKQVDTLSRYLDRIGEDATESWTELREVDSHLHNTGYEVKLVKRNFHYGPYMCHFGMFGDRDEHITLVFLRGVYRGKHSHIGEIQRRITLRKMGVQYVEFDTIDTDNNVV